ncbi:hypothetical protein CcaverHIS002_0208780 [Cutaneotrichosporon cavernicola]|uniref:Galactose-1-phosphate uridylyltransferase n=1 Tax=Cutaneotrichosporon cavernicola TaxID=279322 RepID=A0AA48I555_9TREE|nr:uncharacterized protein CcaverHIS019_0208790 [Cutaneotrichosporon cavernicola]BEI81718.1 hypothetical protein CcaverHIS002_0208780 [Cutaneotrichosporon cavernicola]BEI89517.1 hypothetical protein CcaverHIS019_0208790 [Cutaneotrichosporon cavernicola]BEI97290.1 hypothetical protein CcaverHIS631_0208790 [Cutaneotrichosporon cavernicola]BEJ05064.1 hypothetical protein CcaverHIS641_0208810 [Cutaneotrichosporon cavernicola]
MEFQPTEHPHRRFNPLMGRHVLVSPHRTKRPWNGQVEPPHKERLPSYDEGCYLCPRNTRMGGHVNPPYKDTFVFNNDFPALLPDALPTNEGPVPPSSAATASMDSLFASEPTRGRCSVICFHPRHDLTLARMSVPEIVSVVQKWRDVYLAEGKFLLASGSPDGYVQIFENRGAMMGASAPHPHGQVWSLSYVPDEPATELENLKAYAAAHSKGANGVNGHTNGYTNGHANGYTNGHAAPCRGDGAPCLLCSYAHEEVQRGERVVAIDEEGGWVAVVPFWAVWPFETMVLPYKRHIPSLAQMTPAEDEGLARVLKTLLVRYDNLFKNPFPYSMGLHQAPIAPVDPDSDPSHAHFHFYPPLLRSASVRKFLVGFEMLGEAQRDLTAEQAAARLRSLDDIHYHDIESRAVSRVPSPEGKPRTSPLKPKDEAEVRNADRPIPLFKDLAEVYPTSGVLREGKRWDSLTTQFKERYNAVASHVVRAPGRVNILGEHVDYSLFPVLPAAIEQDILIALRVRNDNTVRVANSLPSFKPAEFSLSHNGQAWDAGLVPPKDGGGWENYLKVALLECLERFFPNGGKPAGLDVLITGNVPPGAGLSSSAAMVVSSVLLFLTANNLVDKVTKGDVVAMAIASEHRMGLRTGGMDQAASALSLKGSLLHLSFDPKLETEPVPLPSGLAVVITNSLAPHSLADSAPERYNLRVVEVLCASRLLLHAWGIDPPPSRQVGEDRRIWLKETLDMLGKKASYPELYQQALDALPSVLGAHPEGWTQEQMVAVSGMRPGCFQKTYLDFVPVRAERFKLLQRAEHTFAESLRVERFVQLCKSKNECKEVGAELGQLINASHESLRDLFECTVPEVEALRDVCLRHGALGARQTGGGWGGAVISLLPVGEVAGFLEKVKRDYAPYASLSAEELDEAVFATLPGVGAGVYTV